MEEVKGLIKKTPHGPRQQHGDDRRERGGDGRGGYLVMEGD